MKWVFLALEQGELSWRDIKGLKQIRSEAIEVGERLRSSSQDHVSSDKSDLSDIATEDYGVCPGCEGVCVCLFFLFFFYFIFSQIHR
jgi:hypothetical protein